jgi:XapX domain-containing protein
MNGRRRIAGMSSTPVATIAALVVGLSVGALFAFLRVPIPAPPELPGVVASVGIYLGFKLVGYAGVGFDLLEALGL